LNINSSTKIYLRLIQLNYCILRFICIQANPSQYTKNGAGGTKSGKEGKAKVTFDGYFGWQTVAHKANMLNAREYMTIMEESNINSGGGPFDWASMKGIYRPDGSLIDTDWLNEMFSNGAKTQSYTLGVTGGSAISTYAISAGYLNQEGIVGGPDVSNFSRYNFRVNSDHKLFGDILEIGEQMAFVYSKQQGQDIGNQYSIPVPERNCSV